ncbi:DUF2330 domain-containing protein [Polyangium mundeleinium]|uniref:DUF2330 domain-containing protein n=1 Tax=Polyangium mundeleinium TaxID=2995306 RepID=A0ABT5EJS5_9BACT|nr:DUF2330 domain-containing protein [Polyangium mundeleinium]MDC0742082.1 DUF2330 domain-containing protein [Polyangium mundeleinium]
MKTSLLATLLLGAPLAALLAPSDAHACGGCVVPPMVNTIVNAHRMALSISPKQTVLWDQIRYNGDPKDWGWILPVKPGAVVELSTDAWFETLDAATSTTVFAPPISCNNGPDFDCGCTQFDSAAGSGGELGPGGGVNVVHRGTVGPYETVTLSTQTPGALDDWLTIAGYVIPEETAPVIDTYVAEGFDFIALRLQPEKGVSDMKPIRVVQTGISPTLPLRMVAVGTGANVDITLFLITEGRWGAKNFENALVPESLVSWDFATNASNYATLREATLAANGGATWLTTFAKQRALLAPIQGAVRGQAQLTLAVDEFGFPSRTANTIAEGYIGQGVLNQETTDQTCIMNFNTFASDTRMVVDPCPAGKPSNDPSCGEIGAGEIDARVFECGESDELVDSTMDDVATALNGLHPADVWLTRLEAKLPRAALAKDLELEPSELQVEVEHEIRARSSKNVDTICPSGVVVLPGSGSGSNKDRGTFVVVLSTLGAGVLALARRRLRGARSPLPA